MEKTRRFAMVIMDTDVLIELNKKNLKIKNICDQLGHNNLVITPIAVAEFLVGVKNRESEPRAQKLINNFVILDFSPEIGQIFMNIYKKYSLSYRPQIPDILIAAFAIYYKVPLFTLNLRHFNFISDL